MGDNNGSSSREGMGKDEDGAKQNGVLGTRGTLVRLLGREIWVTKTTRVRFMLEAKERIIN